MPALLVLLAGWLLVGNIARANIPGGGTGTGPAVTLVNNGNGTVTMANGNITIVITTADASIHQFTYTYNNSGSVIANQLLTGGNNGGVLYWTGNPQSFGTMNFVYAPVVSNTNYAEISLTSTSSTNGIMEVHYSMLRGASGFYTSIIVTHRSTDGQFPIVLRPNIYSGAQFNWMSVDAARNRLMQVAGGSTLVVQGAPKETTLWTSGIYAGQYEDKYKYSADLGSTPVWGWSSVGTGGSNVGLWNVSGSVECYPGGPMERSLMEHIGTTILNVFTGGYYGLATDDTMQNGETFSKVFGPYLYYCNNVTNTMTGTNQAAQALYSDALVQQAAEASAWPYAWFTNANYVPAAGRGTITGKMAISDSGNPNASAANLWVGVVQQPSSFSSTYDFQEWARPYEFWVKTDTNGNFTIPNVIATNNYTLYAFGRGAAGTFMSQNQTGGSPPILFDLPAVPFSVTVSAGATNSLGTVTWTPARVGPTVFEIGYPDRTAAKFKHGDDYWVGDIGPSPTAPSPIWSKWLEYPFDFPNGVSYMVGQNRWSTDWNFIQSVAPDSLGNYNSTGSTITFTLPSKPTSGQASLYLGLTSDFDAAILVTINGTLIVNGTGITGSPNNSLPSTGYIPVYNDSDSNIREGNNGAFTDERLTFPATLLQSNINTINITFRQVGGVYFANHFMYDYLRLELAGYVPPAPANVTVYAGNNGNLVCWPAVPGATSYNILRSTSPGSGYASITNGVTGPVCGSGTNNAVYLDATALNGTAYYYEVQSVNPTGTSANSPASAGATPSGGLATTPPAAPTGFSVTSSGHQNVTLGWTASAGANYYSVWRSTLMNNCGGASNVLSTIILNNSTTNAFYTDTTPSDGSLYTYFVTASSAGGTSGSSTPVAARPLPVTPATAPFSLLGNFTGTTNITLTWTAVPGAVGYAIYRSTSSGGPYTLIQSVTETTYTDFGLSPTTIYYYRIGALNDGGISATASDSVNSQQTYPASLAAVGTNAAIRLSWAAVSGATSYVIKRGTSVGGETTTVISGYAGTTYTNSGLVNGTTYYYVVNATGAGGTSGNSPEASATPFANNSGTWITAANGFWSDTNNWTGGNIATGNASTADFSTLSLATNVTVTFDTNRTLSGLKFGDTTSTYNWTLAGTNTLTFGVSPFVNVVNDSATINTPLAGTAGLGKTGPGTAILGGATNTVTGGVSVGMGDLELDFTPTNTPAVNLLPTGNSLALSGGELQVNGSSNAVSSQSFASTALSTGASTIAAAPVAGTTLPTVSLATVTATAGGLVEFIGPSTIGAGGVNVASNANITVNNTGGNGAFVGASGAFFDANYATVGLYDFAATVGSAAPFTVMGGSQIASFYVAASGSTPPSSGNLDVVGNITAWGTQPFLTSLRFNSNLGANATVTISGSSTTLTLSTILMTPNFGPHNATCNGGVFRSAGGSSGSTGPLVIWQNDTAGEFIFGMPMNDSKAVGATYVQAGPGTVVLAASDAYTGQSYLDGGVSSVSADASVGAVATAAAINLDGGTVLGTGTFAMDNGGVNLRPFKLLGNGGGLAASTGNTMTVDGLVSGGGALTIGIPASAANGNTVGQVPGTGTGTANPTPVLATGTVVLTNANTYSGGTFLQSGTLNINGINALGGGNYAGLTFSGGTLQYAAGLTGNNGSSDLTSIGTAGITLAAGGGTIDVSGNAVTYAGSIGNGGSGSLTVKSSAANGVLILAGANIYTGTTTVTNAQLLAQNTSGSATGQGDVTVQSGATLGGNGTINGSVNILANAVLAPGTSIGILNIGNNLTLAAGSTVVLEIQHLPLTNDAVAVAGALTEGGTLVVTNSGGMAFSAGDSFNLFPAAGGYVGSFSSIVLPALNPGLFWSTDRLTVDGTIGVVSTNAPAISSVNDASGNVVFQGTGGTPNWEYVVLSSPDLSLPVSQWTSVSTNFFDASGNFNWTNSADMSGAQLFYTISVQ